MDSTAKTRLHPLLTAAALSVTLFSAVGIASMTGLLPSSSGKEAAALAPAATESAPPSMEPMVAAPPEVQPQAESPASTPERHPLEVRKAKAPVPNAKPVKKHVVRKSSPLPAAHETTKLAEASSAVSPAATAPAVVPPAPPSPIIEAPKPPPGILGVVESVHEIEQPAEKSNGVGPIVGGIAGALLGHQVGHGTGRTIATVLGAAGGALAGKQVEKKVNSTRHWEVRVRLDDGTSQTLRSDAEPFWHGGERVRLLDGRLTPA